MADDAYDRIVAMNRRPVARRPRPPTQLEQKLADFNVRQSEAERDWPGWAPKDLVRAPELSDVYDPDAAQGRMESALHAAKRIHAMSEEGWALIEPHILAAFKRTPMLKQITDFYMSNPAVQRHAREGFPSATREVRRFDVWEAVVSVIEMYRWSRLKEGETCPCTVHMRRGAPPVRETVEGQVTRLVIDGHMMFISVTTAHGRIMLYSTMGSWVEQGRPDDYHFLWEREQGAHFVPWLRDGARRRISDYHRLLWNRPNLPDDLVEKIVGEYFVGAQAFASAQQFPVATHIALVKEARRKEKE